MLNAAKMYPPLSYSLHFFKDLTLLNVKTWITRILFLRKDIKMRMWGCDFAIFVETDMEFFVTCSTHAQHLQFFKTWQAFISRPTDDNRMKLLTRSSQCTIGLIFSNYPSSNSPDESLLGLCAWYQPGILIQQAVANDAHPERMTKLRNQLQFTWNRFISKALFSTATWQPEPTTTNWRYPHAIRGNLAAESEKMGGRGCTPCLYLQIGDNMLHHTFL